MVQHDQTFGIQTNMSSDIHLLIEDEEVIPEIQEVGELGANKLLSRQKAAGFSHTVKDVSLLGKLIEDVDAKNKALMGKTRGVQ